MINLALASILLPAVGAALIALSPRSAAKVIGQIFAGLATEVLLLLAYQFSVSGKTAAEISLIRYGDVEISDLFPHVAKHAGKLAVVRSMNHDGFTHTAEQEARWRKHLGRAEIIWDFPPNPADLAHAPVDDVGDGHRRGAGDRRHVADGDSGIGQRALGRRHRGLARRRATRAQRRVCDPRLPHHSGVQNLGELSLAV